MKGGARGMGSAQSDARVTPFGRRGGVPQSGLSMVSELLPAFSVYGDTKVVGESCPWSEAKGRSLFHQRPSGAKHLPPHGERDHCILSRLTAPYSTAISDSQQFERRFAPPNCVRCCDCSSPTTFSPIHTYREKPGPHTPAAAHLHLLDLSYIMNI
ncbi:MAG: hypothetical protein ACFWUL_06845 [Dialister sp.]|jgi:hypothetical protein